MVDLKETGMEFYISSRKFTKAFKRKRSQSIVFFNSWTINIIYWLLHLSSDICYSPSGIVDITRSRLFDCYSVFSKIFTYLVNIKCHESTKYITQAAQNKKFIDSVMNLISFRKTFIKVNPKLISKCKIMILYFIVNYYMSSTHK